MYLEVQGYFLWKFIFIGISSLLISIKYVIILVLSYRYLATGGGVLYGSRGFFFYCCHGWCGQPPYQQMVRQQRYRGQSIAQRELCHYKRKEESPNCTLLRFGDFILCPLRTRDFFQPTAIIAYAGLIFNMYFLFINRLCMRFSYLQCAIIRFEHLKTSYRGFLCSHTK